MPAVRQTTSGVVDTTTGVAETVVIPDSVVDNFEDSPDGPYTSGEDITTYYTGDTSQFQRVTSNVFEGSSALGITTDGSINQVYSMPGDGLPRYPKAGETVVFLGRQPSGNPGQTSPLYITDTTNGIDAYGVNFTAGGNEIRVSKWTDGSRSDIGSASASLSESTWYWIEFDTPTNSDTSMAARIYNVSSGPTRGSQIGNEASTTDSDHTVSSGTDVGVGASISSNASDEATFDWFTIQ